MPPFFSQFLNCKRKCYLFLRSQSLDRVHLVFPIFFEFLEKCLVTYVVTCLLV